MNQCQSKINIITTTDNESFLLSLCKLASFPFIQRDDERAIVNSILIANCTHQEIVEMSKQVKFPSSLSDLNTLYQSIYTSKKIADTVTVQAFKEDLKRVNNKNNSFVIALKMQREKVQEWTSSVLKWAEKQAITVYVIFLCEGENEAIINKSVLGSQILCRSYYTLVALDTQHVSLRIKYLFTQKAFIFEKYYHLTYLNERLSIHEKGALIVSSQVQDVSISKALEAPLFLLFNPLKAEESLANMNAAVMNNEKELFNALLETQNAQVLIACQHNTEINNIALLVFTLRTRFGPSVKIIVREMKPCLRYLDLSALLASGANSVINFTHTWQNALDQLYASKFQHYAVTLPATGEQILTKYSLHDLPKGETDISHFVDFINKQSQRLNHVNIHFALVRLKVAANLTPQECLIHCQLRRKGDIITAHNGYLYIYLSAVMPTSIYVALDCIFDININELFAETRCFDNLADIRLVIKEIELNQVNVDGEKLLFNEKSTNDQQLNKYARAVPFLLERKSNEYN